jgi:uncharacterized protein (DUF736 family)
MPNDPNELGALWVKQSAKGEYMTGTINGVKVVVFRNSKKSEEKHPDWRVLKSQPREAKGNDFPPTGADDIAF